MQRGLVGREDELAGLRRLCERSAAGRGGALVYYGPSGAGKTALLAAAADEARELGLEVLQAAFLPGEGQAAWVRLGVQAGLAEAEIGELPRALTGPANRVLLVDDVHLAGGAAIEMLERVVIESRRGGAVIAASVDYPFGIAGVAAHPLRPLSWDDFGVLFDEVDELTRRAVWTASGGFPGTAARWCAALSSAPADQPPLSHLALAPSMPALFLDVQVSQVALLEAALAGPNDDATRARLLARLAHVLYGDPTTRARRQALSREALDLARATDPATTAAVMEDLLTASWDSATAEERLEAANEIIELAHRSGVVHAERDAMFWRFTGEMELGEVASAEATLETYRRLCEAQGYAEGIAVVTARHSMLAAMRGRFGEASELAEQFRAAGRALRMPDTEQLYVSLRAAIVVERGSAETADLGDVAVLWDLARRHPGHHFEASAAFAMLMAGHIVEAGVELTRCVPQLREPSGPRWLRALAELTVVAFATDDRGSAAAILELLEPQRGKLIVSGGANVVIGPVAFFLGMLHLQVGSIDDAIELLDEAAAFQERVGALPGLANSLALVALARGRRGSSDDQSIARERRSRADAMAERLHLQTLLVDRLVRSVDEWSLVADGADWVLTAGDERARLRDARGVAYLRVLLANPGRHVSSLDLAAGGQGLVAVRGEPLLDDQTRDSYLEGIRRLGAELDAADRAGDVDRATRAEAERERLLSELRALTGLGGRSRVVSNEAERARVNVTRTLRATIATIAASAPRVGAHLNDAIRTGVACAYEPAEGGPVRWRL